MKPTITAICFVIFIFAACKPKTESNNGFDMPGSDNSSKKGTWSVDYKQDMMSEIRAYAKKNDIAKDNQLDYAICVINALEIKFPDENVDKQSSEAQKILQDCKTNNTNNSDVSNQPNTNNNSQWSATEQKQFMDNCTPGAIKSLNERAGTEYCDCVMKKLMQEYPNPIDVAKASQSLMTRLAASCR